MSMIDERRWHPDPWDDPEAAVAEVIERPHRNRSRLTWVLYAVSMLVLAALITVGCVGLWYTRQVNPPGDPGDPVTFTVNARDTLETVSVRLEQKHLVTKAWVFRYYVNHHGGLQLTPGYYQLRPKDHMGNIMRVLRTPPSQTFTKVTFPEGFTIAKMGARLEQRVPRLSASDFGVAATLGTVRSTLLPDGQNSLEGLLFPDTYQVSNDETATQLVQRMVALTERVAGQEDLVAKAYKLGLNSYQALIVASLIEREAKVPEDRAKIARVIYNRLALGMPLQIDAAVRYQQDPKAAFSDLVAIDTPYNTYLHTGLPPTPIANPGRASIQAALNPAANPSLGDPICKDVPAKSQCMYLYYVVSDADGHHVFAATAAQHAINVQHARDLGLIG
jgi:UPF0755 protein